MLCGFGVPEMTVWTISTIAQGAAVTLFAQLSPTEKVGFECSFGGLSVLTQAELFKDLPPTSEFVLNLGGSNFKADTVYMLIASPPFWSGSFGNKSEMLSALNASKHFEVSILDRTLKVDLDREKVAGFLDSCSKQVEVDQ